MFYQSEPYFTGDKIKVFEPKDFILNRHNALYFITGTKKIINTFSWGATLYNVANLENIEVKIPVQNGKLDISQYEKDGQKTSFTAVVVTSFDFPIGNQKENAQNENVPF